MADRSERKERLVAALSDTFRTHGYGGASVAVLLRAAGLSKASLYHHFPGGKEAGLEA
jgi:AcrR family transcriptional regulator